MHAVWYLLCFSTLGLIQFSYGNDLQRHCNYSNPCPFVGGEDLVFPSEEKSVNASLSFTLNVDVTTHTIEWLTLHRRTYNGQIPGPTWRIRRGDNVTVVLRNLLMLPQKTKGHNEIRYPNSTNLHTHGLHISSAEPQDNVFVHVHPGENYTYQYQINDEQPAGTFWYHAHLHGSVWFQVQGGMGGMLIVEDEVANMPAHLAAVSCPGNCQHDIILCFQPLLSYIKDDQRQGYAYAQEQIDDDELFRYDRYNLTSGGTLTDWLSKNVDHITTNGQLWPRLNISAGQIKRFRLANAGGTEHLELLITEVGGRTQTPSCEFKEIAYDGIYLDFPRSVSKTLLVPAGRADWLVVCSTAGTYELRSVADEIDELSLGKVNRYNGTLLTINVAGSGSDEIGSTLPAREDFNRDFRNLTQDQVYGRCVLEVNSGFRFNREQFSGNNTRCQLPVNCVNEVYLTSTDAQSGHPVHIHINHFQVTSYNSYTGPFGKFDYHALTLYDQSGERCHHQHAGFNESNIIPAPDNPLKYLGHDERYAAGGPGTVYYAQVGDFRDVILVPPLANITIRFMTHYFTGEVVAHCHILKHEDRGLMLKFEIVDTGSCFNVDKTTSGILSGTAAPGQCARCDPFPFNQDVSNCTATATAAACSLVDGSRSLPILLGVVFTSVIVCLGHHE